MIHARKDYNRIQDPATEHPYMLGEGCTPIGEDEPVFLLRAQDRFFLSMLYVYRDKLKMQSIKDERMISTVEQHIFLAHEWQETHGTKTPDMPKEQSQ